MEMSYKDKNFRRFVSEDRLISHGSFGEVYGPRDWDGKKCAIKKRWTTKEDTEKQLSACDKWMSLHHKSLITVYDVSLEPNAVYVLMEYAGGGSLKKVLSERQSDLPLEIIKDWGIQIAEGMAHLHENDIVHRDLKSPNILIMEADASSNPYNKTLKITDFDQIREHDGTKTMSVAGTYAWTAPEVLAVERFSKASDVWSYGVVLWEILTRDVPYKDVAAQSIIIVGVGNGQLKLKIPDSCPDIMRYFLNRCLSHDKDKRPSFNEILSELQRCEEALTPTAGLEKLIVRGIAELHDRIYVIFQDKPIIRVISDLVKFVKEKDIIVNMMEDPYDLESCAKSQCLYVADRIHSCIWKVDLFSKAKPVKWMEDLKKPHKFSVISGGRIAIPKWPSSIEIRNSDGTLAGTIELPIDMLEPYYVLETSRETLVVAHGHQKSTKHRVCEIAKREGDDSDWVIHWSYPENGSDEITNIDILAMDNEGRIFVTDQNNLRIILLSESGQKLDAISTETLPYRLCYARNNMRLLVGHYGAISVYKVKDVGGGELEIQHLREAVCESFPFENPWTTSKLAQNLGMHLDNDSVKTMEIGDNCVRGITELYKKFYVIFQDKHLIRVFDDRYEILRDIPVQNLSDPWFIDACPKNKCLYITDKGRECIVKIYDLDKKDGSVSVEIWKTKIGEPYKLSVISDGRVLIPIWPATLEVYDSMSQLRDTIVLPDDMREPCHAVEADKGRYILGHGDKKSDTHRVCKIKYSNRKGCEVVWKYGNQRGNKIDQLNSPRNIAIDEKGRVFITDEGNRRLVLLDKNGNRLSTETTNLTPERLIYSRSIDRLLVGHYGSISQYVVDEEDRCIIG